MNDPQELVDAVTEARLGEFGPDGDPDTGVQYPRRYPSLFFSHDVFVIAPDTRTTARAPKYCATMTGALRLANLLKDAGYPCAIVMGAAIELTLSWTDSAPVPIFVFYRPGQIGEPTGSRYNAGLLLDNFDAGNEGRYALNRCRCDIERKFAEDGYRKPVTDEEIAAIMAG